MLNKIVEFALNNRLIVGVLSVVIVITGIISMQNIAVDVFPDLNAPTVVILTEAHGLAPEEVEKLVTFPIETSINGSTGLRRVRSTSSEGFSIVWAEFDWEMDPYHARQVISEKLITVTDLPEGVDRPILAPQASLMGEIMIIALTSDSISQMELRSWADWKMRPQLLSVKGVAQVTVHGGELMEYQILADPLKMKHYGVTLSELYKSCKNLNDNAAGGFFNEYGNRYLIRGKIRTSDPNELKSQLIKMQGHSAVTIGHVAEVKKGAAPKIGVGSYRAKESVIITIAKQPNINTLTLTEDLKRNLDDLQRTMPKGVRIQNDIFDQSDFILTSVNNVKKALMEGGFLVAIILFLFLMNIRPTIISLLAIPLSLFITILTMKWFGITLNTMTLGGMAIAIGSLVDDAIIDVENVYKRLRENIALPLEKRQALIKVVYQASVEIRPSIWNATIIIIVAFIPLFFLTGMEGRMLRPLGIAYIVSLFASLIVAMTVTPALCSVMFRNEKRLKKHHKKSFLESFLAKHYAKSLEYVLNKRKWVIILTAIALVGSIGLLLNQGRSFLPPFNEGTLTINVATLPGISLDESNKIGQQAELALLGIAEITTIERRTGRSELAEHSFGSNVSEIDAPFLLDHRSREEFLKEVREKLTSIPGAMVEVGQPVSHRMNHMLSGTRTGIAIKLFGDDLSTLFIKANEIKDEIQSVEGITDLNVEQQVEIPQIRITPRRTMLAKYGISLQDFKDFISIAFAGTDVSDAFDGDKKFHVVLRFKDEYRNQIKTLRHTLIDTYHDKKIPLEYIADIESVSGPNSINRENVQRKIVISANVAERDMRSVVNDIQNTVRANIELDEGYYVEYGGQFESEEAASRILLLTSLMAIVIIFMLLFHEFKKLNITTVVMMNLPLALIGGIVTVALTSGVISIPSIIGFITLFGIATRNGILLVSRYQNLKSDNLNLRDIILQGSADRLNAILMTALTAALALVPLAINGEQAGNEIQSPMAMVILGGLLTATLLNVYVIPVFYEYIEEKNNAK
ncbi:efflux RND transporter permease subunit [bacterium]|nr:efflux RND transporter permease subunit [bacterium]